MHLLPETCPLQLALASLWLWPGGGGAKRGEEGGTISKWFTVLVQDSWRFQGASKAFWTSARIFVVSLMCWQYAFLVPLYHVFF